MRISRGQLRRLIREEAGRMRAYAPDFSSIEARSGALEGSDEFDAALQSIMDAARVHRIDPAQVLDALRDALT